MEIIGWQQIKDALSLLLEQLAPFLKKEAKLVGDVHGAFRQIKGDLESIHSALKVAEERADQEDSNQSLKTWMKQTRETAFEIEDVMDEYMHHVAQPHHSHDSFVRKAAREVGKLRKRHDIASKIQDIQASIQEIMNRRERYHSGSSEQGSSSGADNFTWHDPRLDSLFIREHEVVGIESAREKLTSWLVDEESNRMVISVVGMGGLGKTTLAKKVYDDRTRRPGQFDCHAWITVSKTYKMEDLLKTMFEQFLSSREERGDPGENIDEMEKLELISKFREYLQEKRYLVVFDDVWEENFWGSIEHALLENNKGSRIIVTTRSKEVAASPKKSSMVHIHNLQPLPQDKAWELFCKKAFRYDFGGQCPQELEELSRRIVRRCGGLPLAIVVIGGLLSTKDKVVSQWKKMHDNLGVELESNLHLKGIKRILTLSYHDLPYHLKDCFLYFAIFPEDYSISCMRLNRLWIAEGFVEDKKGKTMEESAEECLMELIRRSLVQVSWVDYFGKARSCRVHDLMREIILSKFEELGFCHVCSEEDSAFNGVTRRLSIHRRTNNVAEIMLHSHIRSAFLFELPKSFMMVTFIENLRLARILDFQGVPIDHVPEEIGNLFHLRYLSLRNTKVTELPESMSKLYNLETLDLKHTNVHEVLFETNGLPKLRHFLAFNFEAEINYSPSSIIGMKIPGGIGRLKALQKLSFVQADHGGVLIKELEELTHLRKLGITKLTTEGGKALCSSLEKMKHLRSLELWAVSEDEIIDLASLSSPPQSLEHVILRGRLENLPDWIPKLENLVRLNLYWSGLTIDPLQVLHVLPNLVDLSFCQAYDGEQLHFDAGRFQKLKVLWLHDLRRLNSVKVDKGALPFLEQLVIGPSPQLQEVPSGIQHLTKLNTLVFYDMSKGFVRGMLQDGGHDYWKIEHITNVLFNCKLGGDYHNTYRLGDSDMLNYFRE